MFSNNDNFESNILDSLNILNRENNDYIFNINNYNYFSLNINNSTHNESKDFPITKDVALFSKKNNQQINYNSCKNLEYKNKKLFKIIHLNRKYKNNKSKETKNEIKKCYISFSSKVNNLINDNKEQSNKIENRNENNNQLIESFDDNTNKFERKRVKHNKFYHDNLLKKCKHLVLVNTMEFINKKIYNIYEGNIGNNIYRKELLVLNKSQKTNSNIMYNRIFINKKISDILSDNISSRYTNYLPQHNKLLIERLKNDKDINISLYFKKLFDLTFLQCLKYFIGQINIEELEGMKCFENCKDMLGDDEEYIKLIKYYLENFEKIINDKNPRQSKKNNNQ